MRYSIFITVINLCFSCQNLNSENYVVSERVNVKNSCKEFNSDLFIDIRLDGYSLKQFNKKKIIEDYKNPDSTINGYFFYRKNNLFFEKDKIAYLEVFDDWLIIDGISFSSTIEQLKNKYPCSFTNRSWTDFNGEKCLVVEVYNDRYDRVRFFISESKIIGIIFETDEIINPDYDQLNNFDD